MQKKSNKKLQQGMFVGDGIDITLLGREEQQQKTRAVGDAEAAGAAERDALRITGD